MFKNTNKNIFVDENNKIKIISSKILFSKLHKNAIEQLQNISKLPISNYVYGFPDLHVGHGVPIGSAFAVDLDDCPVISPKAIGTDINCGIRLIRTNLNAKNITADQYKDIVKAFEKLPIGLSKDGIKITKQDLIDICYEGLEWSVKHSYADKFDKLYVDYQGCLADASPKYLSKEEIDIALQQLGTLGQGNHFIDILIVDKIFDKSFCKKHKITKGQIMVMLHTGSRGLGFKVAERFTKLCKSKEPIDNLDFNSKVGKHYYKTMCAVGNYAFVNRSVLSKKILDTLENTLFFGHKLLKSDILYDCSHNLATIEIHNKSRLLVTRKGAIKVTLSRELPSNSRFIETGTPIILPGSMLDDSYVLLPKPKIKETLCTIAHGCGRQLSREDAKKMVSVIDLKERLLKKGIYLSGHSENVIREEQPAGYKSSEAVVDSLVGSGICKKAFSLKPKVVITG